MNYERRYKSDCLDFLKGMKIMPTEVGTTDAAVQVDPRFQKYLSQSADLSQTDWTNERLVSKGTVLDDVITRQRVTTAKIRELLNEGSDQLLDEVKEFIKQIEQSKMKGADILNSFRHANFPRKVLKAFEKIGKIIVGLFT